MIVEANEVDFSSSDYSCFGEDGHDPFKCKYGVKHLGIKSEKDWRQRINHYRKIKEKHPESKNIVKRIDEHKEEVKRKGILPEMSSRS